MSYLSSKSRQIQSQLANVKRHRPDDFQAYEALRQQFHEERIADFITKTLSEAPPLAPEQRERLALLLHGTSPVRGAAA